MHMHTGAIPLTHRGKHLNIDSCTQIRRQKHPRTYTNARAPIRTRTQTTNAQKRDGRKCLFATFSTKQTTHQSVWILSFDVTLGTCWPTYITDYIQSFKRFYSYRNMGNNVLWFVIITGNYWEQMSCSGEGGWDNILGIEGMGSGYYH